MNYKEEFLQALNKDLNAPMARGIAFKAKKAGDMETWELAKQLQIVETHPLRELFMQTHYRRKQNFKKL